MGHLRETGVNVLNVPVWDVQLAHFILSKQQHAFPSLDEVLAHHGFEPKIDVVKTQYWDRNIDTDMVPWDILCEYGEGDVIKTYQCYLKQLDLFKEQPTNLFKLFKLQCRDLVVLHEMEYNGLKYNSNTCKELSEKLQIEIDTIVRQLSSFYPDVSINFNSGDQLSAFLYGGTIPEEKREIIGVYKSGAKTGLPRYRVIKVEHELPRMFEPLRGSEMAKEGIYSTAEATIKKLKGKPEIRDALLRLAKLSKLNETYYVGLDKVNREMCWKDNELHSNYNQCRAATGRLSSSQPNGQNLSGDVLEVLESRYG